MNKPKRRLPPPTPRAHRFYLNIILQEPDGWTEADLWKARVLVEALDRMLDVVVRLPGIESAFPPTEKRGPHCHPAFLLCRNALYHVRVAITERIEKIKTESPL